MSPLDDVASLLGPAQVLTAPEDITPYARDWTGRYAAPRRGWRWCRRAGGQALCGGAMASADGPPAVVLSLERMNRVRNVDARDFSITVDAGCTVRAVQLEAEAHDRFFPLSFGAEGTAQIGGALSTNAGGIRTIRWGNARDLVLGIEVLLPDGRVLDDLRRVRKDNTGYALRHLLLGGEGGRWASSPAPR
jgi:FAD/FMN-containing dehydrogenase